MGEGRGGGQGQRERLPALAKASYDCPHRHTNTNTRPAHLPMLGVGRNALEAALEVPTAMPAAVA